MSGDGVREGGPVTGAFERAMDEELRAARASMIEEATLLLDVEVVRIFGTPDEPAVFVGIRAFMGEDQ